MDLHSDEQRTSSEGERREPWPKAAAPELQDHVHSLAVHVGEGLVHAESALAYIGSDDWTPETQAAVRRQIAFELVADYAKGSELLTSTPKMLEEAARAHLARFVIAMSVLTTERAKRDAGASACAEG